MIRSAVAALDQRRVVEAAHPGVDALLLVALDPLEAPGGGSERAAASTSVTSTARAGAGHPEEPERHRHERQRRAEVAAAASPSPSARARAAPAPSSRAPAPGGSGRARATARGSAPIFTSSDGCRSNPSGIGIHSVAPLRSSPTNGTRHTRASAHRAARSAFRRSQRGAEQEAERRNGTATSAFVSCLPEAMRSLWREELVRLRPCARRTRGRARRVPRPSRRIGQSRRDQGSAGSAPSASPSSGALAPDGPHRHRAATFETSTPRSAR